MNPGTEVLDINKVLAEEAAQISKRIAAGAPFIKCTQDKKFMMPDKTESAGPLSAVIIDFIAANYFFDREYEKGAIVPPACFALAVEPRSMVPHETAPAKEAEACNGCPNNEFGSKGKGKACQNTRLLAVVSPDEKDPQIYLLKVSATGVKPFDNYVQSIKTQFNAPPLAVVTDIFFDKNARYGSLRFGNPRPNPKLRDHFELRGQARDILLAPPDVSQYEPINETKAAKKK